MLIFIHLFQIDVVIVRHVLAERKNVHLLQLCTHQSYRKGGKKDSGLRNKHREEIRSGLALFLDGLVARQVHQGVLWSDFLPLNFE